MMEHNPAVFNTMWTPKQAKRMKSKSAMSPTNDEDLQWKKLIYGDQYFNENIAAGTSYWDQPEKKAWYQTRCLIAVAFFSLFATATLVIIMLTTDYQQTGQQQQMNNLIFETTAVTPENNLLEEDVFESRSTNMRVSQRTREDDHDRDMRRQKEAFNV